MGKPACLEAQHSKHDICWWPVFSAGNMFESHSVDYNTQRVRPTPLWAAYPVPIRWLRADEVPSALRSLFNANDCHLESSAFLLAAHCLINVKSRVKKTLDLCNSCFWPSQVWLLEVILTWHSIMSAWLSKSRRRLDRNGDVWVCVHISFNIHFICMLHTWMFK